MSTTTRLTMLHRIKIVLLLALMLAQDTVLAAKISPGTHSAFSEDVLLKSSEALSVRADGGNYT